MLRHALVFAVVLISASAALASQADRDFESTPVMGGGQLILPGSIEFKAIEASKKPICKNFSGGDFISYYHRMDDRLRVKNIDGHKKLYDGVAHAIDDVFKRSCADASVSQNDLLSRVLNTCLNVCDSNSKVIKNGILGNQQNDVRFECEITCTGFYSSLDSFARGAYAGIMQEKDCLASPRHSRNSALSNERSSDRKTKAIKSRRTGGTGAFADPAGNLE